MAAVLAVKKEIPVKTFCILPTPPVRFRRTEDESPRLLAYHGGGPFSYALFGVPVKGLELAGQRWSVYRFHLDSPTTFTKSLRATIEHGHANDRADDYYSVAYWYQTEPHAAFPPLPAVEERVPKLHPPAQ